MISATTTTTNLVKCEEVSKMSEHTQNIESELSEFNFVSPYKLSQIESTLRGSQIPPQKLYGYVSKGYVKATTGSTGKLQISRSEAAKYLERTMKRNS